MKKWLRNRKAVSPVIAALLLIAISVAAAVITYSWVMTMIEGQGSQAQTNIRFEEVSFDNATGNIFQVKMVIRNAGGVTAQIQTFYLYLGDTRLLKVDDVAYAISAGDTAELGFANNTDPGVWVDDGLSDPIRTTDTEDFELLVSKAYSVRIVTDNGFTIEGTFYTPSGW